MTISQAARARELGISPAAMTKRIKKWGFAAAMETAKIDDPDVRRRGYQRAIVNEPAPVADAPDYQSAAEQRATMWPERNSGDRFRLGATAAEVKAALAKG
jgi:hypothetical protein